MPTFICEKCGCVDNTACGGTYWSVMCYKHSEDKKRPPFSDDWYNNHVVCSMCSPPVYIDGSKNREAGKWDKFFPKKHWSEYGDKERIIAKYNKKQGDLVNAMEYFESLQEGDANCKP